MSYTQAYVNAVATGSGNGTSDANAWTITQAVAGVTAGTQVNIKAGTYLLAANLAFSVAGTQTADILWSGYKTTINDQDANANPTAGTDIPLFACTNKNIIVGGAYQRFANLAATGAPTANISVWKMNAGQITLQRVQVTTTGTTSGYAAISFGSSLSGITLIGCYASGGATQDCYQFATGDAGVEVIGCYASGGLNGFNCANAAISLYRCIAANNAGDAIKLAPSSTGQSIKNCSIYNPGANGVNITTVPTSAVLILNSHFENVLTSGAINNTSGLSITSVRLIGNSYYNNANNLVNLAADQEIFPIATLAGSGFVNASGGNFSPSSLVKALGFPGAFEVLGTIGYPDNGAVQSSGASGSAGVHYIANMCGGLVG